VPSVSTRCARHVSVESRASSDDIFVGFRFWKRGGYELQNTGLFRLSAACVFVLRSHRTATFYLVGCRSVQENSRLSDVGSAVLPLSMDRWRIPSGRCGRNLPYSPVGLIFMRNGPRDIDCGSDEGGGLSSTWLFETGNKENSSGRVSDVRSF